jgi:type IV secretory pathway VirJ component
VVLRALLVLTGLWLGCGAAIAASAERLDLIVRGQTISLTIYKPKATPRGTIVMAGGDVGWVGLAASMAEELSAEGFLVVGLNARQYLAAFTSGKDHLQPKDVPSDYQFLADRLKETQLLVRPVILSGVSEGAALAVLAAAEPKNHAWIDGVITMGLPATAELAWRWTDLWASAMKKDADEPSFTVADFLPGVAPLPLCMIQSKKDEYVTPADYERFRTIAKEPKQLVLIDAANHRFTDRRPELSRAFADGLVWIVRAGKPGKPGKPGK